MQFGVPAGGQCHHRNPGVVDDVPPAIREVHTDPVAISVWVTGRLRIDRDLDLVGQNKGQAIYDLIAIEIVCPLRINPKLGRSRFIFEYSQAGPCNPITAAAPRAIRVLMNLEPGQAPFDGLLDLLRRCKPER